MMDLCSSSACRLVNVRLMMAVFLYRSAQESTRGPKIFVSTVFPRVDLVLGEKKEYARSGFVEKNGGGGAAASFGGSFVRFVTCLWRMR